MSSTLCRRSKLCWALPAAILALVGGVGGWMWGRARAGAPLESSMPPGENRLAKETSPYLLLHKHNPVDWYPWGSEAFAKAKAEDKPIFLSIGYSSCYWCHVMERESFSDPEIAQNLNQHFVSIKVDREELPDVDENYMTAVHVMGGRGGWPLSVFLTPEGKPFFGGTYFPPRDRPGMTGFATILDRVAEAWRDQRKELESHAGRVQQAVRRVTSPQALALANLDRGVIERGVSELAADFDPAYGGFGYSDRQSRRPKFPQPPRLRLLLYQARQAGDRKALEMLTKTLDHMARGGIWDHLGGGFHRYSTDRFWQVPHFEKMLYDNAQLAGVYLEAYELTRNESYARQAEAIFAFVAREMTSPQGAFYSALDAESEHEEGKYYVWSTGEVQDLLSPESYRVFASVYGLDGTANFEGNRYVLLQSKPPAEAAKQFGMTPEALERTLEPMRQKLLEPRGRRPRPLLDTKVLTDWNGLMIAALADGYRILGKEAYRETAEAAAFMLLEQLRDRSGGLLHCYAGGVAKLPAYLDDYAYLLEGLLALDRARPQGRWRDEALALADQMVDRFWDERAGGFYYTSSEHDTLLARIKMPHDSVRPSGNSAAVRAMVALARRTGNQQYTELAGQTLGVFSGELATRPSAVPYLARGLGEYLDAGFPPQLLAAPPARRPLQVVRAEAKVSHDRLLPGRPFELAVVLNVRDGWHINANPASLEELVPTMLQLASDLPLESVRVRYPEPVRLRAGGFEQAVAVYQGRVVLRAAATLGKGARPGKEELEVTVRYQPCDDRRCLPPEQIQLAVPVEVVVPK